LEEYNHPTGIKLIRADGTLKLLNH
jgi:hypothetical protein